MRAKSAGTGRFLGCYANTFLKGHRALIEVRQGPRVCFVPCPLCGTKSILCEQSGWRAGSMSLEEAERLRDDPRNPYPVFVIRAPSPAPEENDEQQPERK